MSKSIFSSCDDELLVEEVGKQNVLYDSSHSKHKDIIHKDVIWNNISAILGKSTEDCKKRWRNILDTYMRHKKKLGTGSAAPIANKKWLLADHLRFLDNVEYERNTATNVNKESDYVIIESENFSIEEVSNETVLDKIPGKRSRSTKLDFVKRANDRTAIINNLLIQNQAILNVEATADEIDLFFKSMALSVKKLSPRGRTEAKLQVLTVISQLEDKYLFNAPQTTSNYSSYYI